MFCPKCNATYGAYTIRFNTRNDPVEVEVDPTYCPVCGWTEKEDNSNDTQSTSK